MPKINRPLAFPELARGRTFAQPWNIKVEPCGPEGKGLKVITALGGRCSD